ncbi:MAG: alpha/beta hydrolase family protein [Promethearchaeota archaeon]|jgi:dipeptidyl aminopeptidase/acylaminoacyl peptidase
MSDIYLENLMTLPVIWNATLSPDGKKVVFSWQNVHPNVDVFSIFLDDPSKPVALSKTPEVTLFISFYPSSQAIIIGEDKNRNERVRLFKVKFSEPENMIPLTMEDPPFFIRGGRIHPNEKWLIYGANYDFTLKKEIEPTWVYRHDLISQEYLILAKPNKPTWVLPKLSQTGDNIIYNRKELHPKGDQIWMVDIEGTEDFEILNFGKKARVKASWLQDSKRIAFLTDTKKDEMQKYYSFGFYDIQTSEIDWIIDDSSRNIEFFSVPKNSNYLVISEIKKAKLWASILDLTTMEERFLPDIRGSLLPIGPITPEEWVGIYFSSTHPTDLVRFDLDPLEPDKFNSLTDVWGISKIKKSDLTPAKGFEWQARDGLNIHGWLYTPAQPNGKTIVYVHGGPTDHSMDLIYSELQYYAHRGFTVFDPNYRGSTGYGVEFEDLIREKGWGEDEQKDIWDGIEALIKQRTAVKGKIGITGTSYGGYSAWFGITKAPKELIAAAVPICGMTDLVVDYETTRPDLRPYSEQMLGGTPEQIPEIYYERSPINFVKNIKGKLLVVQGVNDPNVTPKNVEEIQKKLKEHKIDFEEYIFEDEGHGIIKTKNQKILYEMIADFFESAL